MTNVRETRVCRSGTVGLAPPSFCDTQSVLGQLSLFIVPHLKYYGGDEEGGGPG